MNKDEFSEVLNAQLYAQEHGLLNDPIGVAIHKCLTNSIVDEFISKELMNRVHRHKMAKAFSGNPFRLPQLKTGDFLLGFDPSGNPILVSLQYFNAHFLMVGNSGSGKTTFLLFHLLEIAKEISRTKRSMGIWLFDWRKSEFLVLRPFFAKLGIDLKIVPGRKVRVNPLQVPRSVSPEDYAPRIADVLVQVLRLQPRSTKLVHATILKLYRDTGILSGGNNYPTLFTLFDVVKSNRDSNAQARQSVLDSLEPVLLSLGVEVLGYHNGWSTFDLAKESIVFDFSGLGEADKDLILNTLMLSEFTSRIARGISNQKMQLYIVCDEAARLVSSASGSLGVADQIGLIRGAGVSLSLSLQTGDVAQAIQSNTAIRVVGRCGSARDYESISSAMGLSAEERRWMALNLEPGKFVCQLSEEWRYPFILHTPNIDLRSKLGGPLETEHLGNLANLPVLASTNSTPEFVDNPVAQISAHSASEASRDLNEAEHRYLSVVFENPSLPSSQYSSLAKIGQKRAKKIRERLVNEGYLREHQLDTRGVGRNSIILEPLELAYQVTGRAKNSGGN